MKKKKPSFEEALSAATLWCSAWDKDELSDEVLADRVAELLETKNGIRAFFAISLSSESALMDRIPESLLIQLRNAGEAVVDITAKNLAMSTAMSLHHKKNTEYELQSASERIKERCIDLLKKLESTLVKKRLDLLIAATEGEGEDVQFFNRWGYDVEQRLAIAESIYFVAENGKA